MIENKIILGGKMRTVKTSAGKNSYRWNWNEFKYLVQVLRQARNFSETLNTFIDLHTQKEISEIIRRVLVASYLVEGLTYDQVAEKTGAARATIAKINQKMMRQKTALSIQIKKAGFYKEFLKTQVDERDAVTSLLDNTLAKRDIFGLFRK